MSTSTNRAHNFNAGPSALPLSVLQKAQAELLDCGGAGMSIMEMSHRGKEAAYVMTGVWSEKALDEAKKLGETYEAANSKAGKHSSIPALSDWTLQPDTAYLHLTSNNTIFGTQWREFPDTGDVPLVADMSSDILSRPVDVSKFSMIYAGAQKNLDPTGVTLAIIKKSFLATANPQLPTMLKYGTFAKENSLYNTPPTFDIYLMGLVWYWPG